MRLVRLVRARLLRSASTRKSSQSRLKALRLRGMDKEAHPDFLLQTERVQQRREFNVKLVKRSASIDVSQRGGGGRQIMISNLGHGVRMDGRRHRHDHCLHYGRLLLCVVGCMCQSGVNKWDRWCLLEWINFLLLRNGRVMYEKGTRACGAVSLTEGVASPLTRPLQRSDQACSAPEPSGRLNRAKP